MAIGDWRKQSIGNIKFSSLKAFSSFRKWVNSNKILKDNAHVGIVKSKVMRDRKFFLMRLDNIGFHLSKLGNPLFWPLKTHSLLKISEFVLIFLKFRLSILWEDPRHHRILVEIAICPTTCHIQTHQIFKVWYLIIEPFFSQSEIVPIFDQIDWLIKRITFKFQRFSRQVLIKLAQKDIEFGLRVTVKGN